jgi:multiple sugar transport system permease protein
VGHLAPGRRLRFAFAVRIVPRRLLRFAFAALIVVGFGLPVLYLLLAPFDPRGSLAVELPVAPTLAHFVAVFRNPFAMRALANSAILALGTMLLTTLSATLAAYALSRSHVPGRGLFTYALILFSSVVTGAAAMVPIFLLVLGVGLIDTQIAVILVMAGGLLPTAVFILRDFVDGLPRSYEEAALVAGATPWQMFRDVASPLLRPGMTVVAIWAFVNAWGAFLVPFVLLRTPSRMPAAIAIYSFYTEAGTPILTLVTAYALLYTLPVVALYAYVTRRYGFRFFGGIKR